MKYTPLIIILLLLFIVPTASSQCLKGEVRPCSIDVGICKRGSQECLGDDWTECTGVVPQQEICGNSLDDNCNGLVDECLFGWWPFILVSVVFIFLLLAFMLFLRV